MYIRAFIPCINFLHAHTTKVKKYKWLILITVHWFGIMKMQSPYIYEWTNSTEEDSLNPSNEKSWVSFKIYI